MVKGLQSNKIGVAWGINVRRIGLSKHAKEELENEELILISILTFLRSHISEKLK